MFSDAVAKKLFRDESLARYTAARLGGPADWLYVAKTQVELVEVMQEAWTKNIPMRILGGGTNVLISDKGFRGLMIINDVSEATFSDAGVLVSGGMGMVLLTRKCQSKGLSGLEWAASLPGTVGGAAVNNAGAHGSDMSECVRQVQILDALTGEQTLTLEDLAYGYRTSSLKQRPDRRFVILWATLALKPDDRTTIQQRMDGFIAYRKRTQPPGASLGSIFKNPSGDYAGRVIEAAGLKGYTIGGAQVSPVHANFFINIGTATASDYYALILHVQDVVYKRMGIQLETEIELVGEWF